MTFDLLPKLVRTTCSCQLCQLTTGEASLTAVRVAGGRDKGQLASSTATDRCPRRAGVGGATAGTGPVRTKAGGVKHLLTAANNTLRGKVGRWRGGASVGRVEPPTCCCWSQQCQLQELGGGAGGYDGEQTNSSYMLHANSHWVSFRAGCLRANQEAAGSVLQKKVVWSTSGHHAMAVGQSQIGGSPVEGG